MEVSFCIVIILTKSIALAVTWITLQIIAFTASHAAKSAGTVFSRISFQNFTEEASDRATAHMAVITIIFSDQNLNMTVEPK